MTKISITLEEKQWKTIIEAANEALIESETESLNQQFNIGQKVIQTNLIGEKGAK